MKLAIQVAMPSELSPLLPEGAKAFETIAGIGFYELEGGVLACAGGVGKVNAALCAEILCLHYGVDMILNIGVAGSMEDLPTGTLVVAGDFVQHDVDTSAVGDPVGLVSTVNVTAFPTWESEHIAALLKSQGCECRVGRVASGDWFATASNRAGWIRDTFSPLLIEMEGCAIAQVCLRNNVRFVSVKSVSDRLFGGRQKEEYFDFGAAIQKLCRVAAPLASALSRED